MPNSRRRKLSTAMSAVAALAVASPIAAIGVVELTATPQKSPEQREFVRAAVVTDLPNELLSALQQGLSQFGINLPPLPTGLSPAGAQPVQAGPTLTTPSLAPGLSPASAGLPGLTTGIPSLPSTPAAPAAPGLDLTNPALTPPATPAVAGLTPGLAPLTTPSAAGTMPGLAPGLAPLTTPSPAAAVPGLSVPPVPATPSLTSPSATGLGVANEQPISAPLGPVNGTYPILGGDPSLAMPAAPASGGIISDLSSAANQLGVGQAIDLLKGVVMPSITQAIQSASTAAAATPAAAAAPAG